MQRAAQVLDEFEDEDIGVGLIDAKLDKVVAKKLGKYVNREMVNRRRNLYYIVTFLK